MTNNYRLSIQLVPQQLWFRNLRKLMSQYEWSKLRKKVIAERGLVCETCGFVAPLSKNIFCHEKWTYETSTDPWIAKLIGIEMTCWNCHSIEHWKRTEMLVAQGTLRTETLDLLVNHFLTRQFNSEVPRAVGLRTLLAGFCIRVFFWGES